MKQKQAQAQTPTSLPDFKPNYWFAIISAIIGFLLYANTIKHDYVLDDKGAITDNEFVLKGISGIPGILSSDLWHFENATLGYYRPLSLITFAIENQFFPGNPHVSHLGNVILYTFTGFFLCLFLMNVFKHTHPLFSFIVTLLFLAHPIHTEVVANNKSRDELLAFLNLTLGLFIFLKAHQSKKINFKRLSLSCVFFYLALLSKETAMTGLLIAPLILSFSLNKTFRQSVAGSIPFFLMILIFFLQKYQALGMLSGEVPNDIVNYPYEKGTRFSSTLLLFLHYLRLTVFPHPLSYDYSYSQIPAIKFNMIALAGLVVAGALTYYSIKSISKKSFPAFGILFFLITLSPAIAFILTRGGILAERFLYAPSLGFCIVIGWLLYFKFSNVELKNLKKFAIPLFSFFLIFFLYSFKTVTRNNVWKDNLTLFSTDIRTSPNSCQVHRHYGSELIAKGVTEKDSHKKAELLQKGVEQQRIAIRINPHFGDAFFQIGYAYQHVIINDDSAIYYYNRAIEESPSIGSTYNNLGVVYEKLGSEELASYYFNKALEVNPNLTTAIQNNAAHKKRTGLDVRTFPTSLDPMIIEKMAKNKDALFYLKLGTLIMQKDTTHLPEAAKYLEKAIEMDPKLSDAYLNLASCYGMTKKYPEALETLNRLLKIDPNNAFAYILLGVTYEKTGDNEKAKECNEMAKKLSSQRRN